MAKKAREPQDSKIETVLRIYLVKNDNPALKIAYKLNGLGDPVVGVDGQLLQKGKCLYAIAEAIKIVTQFAPQAPSPIIRPGFKLPEGIQ